MLHDVVAVSNEHDDLAHQPMLESEIRARAGQWGQPTQMIGIPDEPSGTQNLLLRLIATCNTPGISHTHRAAACNLLSTTLTRVSESSDAAVSNLLWVSNVWTQSFHVYLDQFSNSKPKPIKQLLGSLLKVLGKNINGSLALDSRNLLMDCISDLLEQSIQHPAPKPAMQAFTLALEKDLVTPRGLCNYKQFKTKPPVMVCEQWMYDRIIQLAKLDDLGPSLESLLKAVIKSSRRTSSPGENHVLWFEPIIRHYKDANIHKNTYRHYVLPAIVHQSFDNLTLILDKTEFHALQPRFDIPKREQDDSSKSNMSTDLMISCLLVGASCGFVKVGYHAKSVHIFRDHHQIVIPLPLLENLLTAESKVLRVGGMTLLFGESVSSTKFPEAVLELLLSKLPHLLADSDPDFRCELFGMTQRLFDRLRASACICLKQDQKHVHFYQSFLKRLVLLLEAELRPSNTYQHHIGALNTLHQLARSGIDPNINRKYWSRSALVSQNFSFRMTLFTRDSVTCMLGMLTDPFDDVRDLAMSISFMLLGSGEPGFATLRKTLSSRLREVEQVAAQSGRADEADGVARMYFLVASSTAQADDCGISFCSNPLSTFHYLVEQCRRSLEKMSKDLTKEIRSSALHAWLNGVRYMVEYQLIDSTAASSMVLEVARRTWNAVKPVLCDDAPEGYMPTDVDSVDHDLSTQDILSFSWRALKDTSLLQRAEVTKGAGMIDPSKNQNDLESTLELCFEQLQELRHRGAFSTVAQTFSLACTRYQAGSRDPRPLLMALYQRLINVVKNASTINTRRSAGLPAILTGLLTANQETRDLFDLAYADLSTIAGAEICAGEHQALSQVHALNCIKDMIRDPKLGILYESHIPAALNLSGRCLTSPIWGIRNSGLMLFRALMDRLLGTSDLNGDDISISKFRDVYTRHPELIDLVNRLISTDKDLSDSADLTDKVFPALQLLQRAPPPVADRTRIATAVMDLVNYKQWMIRDKAARTFAALHQGQDIVFAIEELLQQSHGSWNAEHGKLLTIKYLLRSLPETALRDGYIQSVLTALGAITGQSTVPDWINAICFDICREQLARLTPVEAGTVLLRAFLGKVPLQSVFEVEISRSLSRGSVPRPNTLRAISAILPYSQDCMEHLAGLAARLSSIDSDATRTLLNSCLSVLGAPENGSTASQHFARAAFQVILDSDAASSETKSTAMQVVIACTRFHVAWTKLDLDNLSEIWWDRSKSLYTSPLMHDETLVVSAIVLATDMSRLNAPVTTLARAKRLLLQIREAAKDDEPYDTRMAATKSLIALSEGVSALQHKSDAGLPGETPLLLDIAITAYDMTNDDDDEIRIDAARLAGNLLDTTSSMNMTLVPLAASARMLTQVIGRFGHRRELASIAVRRLMFGEQPEKVPTSVSELLAVNTARATILFVEEKRNLYIDPAREARVWSQVLMRIDPAALDGEHIRLLQDWTISNLRAVQRHAEIENAGGLDWSSSPALFALGLRLIFGAGSLLHVNRRVSHQLVDASRLRHELIGLLRMSRTCELHPMWPRQIEKILVADVIDGVRKVGQRLLSLPICA